MSDTQTKPRGTEGILNSFQGLHPALVMQRSLKLAENTWTRQYNGVLFAAPCTLRGVAYTHQGFMRLNDQESVNVLAIVNDDPGVSTTTGNERAAVGIFLRPMNSPGTVKFASLWRKATKEGGELYYDGGTERSIADKVYMRIFQARVKADADQATALEAEELLGSVEGLGADGADDEGPSF